MKNNNYDLKKYDVGYISYDLINLPYLRKIKFKGILKKNMLEKILDAIKKIRSRSSP